MITDKTVLTTPEEITAWFTPMPSILSFDFETTSLSYLKMNPVGLSFCDGKRACYVDLEKDSRDSLMAALGSVFRVSTTLFIGHNLKYDLNCCHKFMGVVPTRIFDTYTAAFLLDENMGSIYGKGAYSLKHLADIHLHVPVNQIHKWEQAESYGHGSPQWYEYCFNDSIWAFALYHLYETQLRKERLDYLFYQIEMPFLPVLAYMERTGVLIDKVKLDKLQHCLEARLREVEDSLLSLCGKTPVVQFGFFDTSERKLPVNFNSSQQVMMVLEGFGLEIPKNRKGKKSLDKKLIQTLEGKHPFVDLYLEYKKLTKLYSSYVLPAWDLIEEDGRIRPSFGFARTGRLTCSNPNLQNLPRLDKKHKELNYRSIIRAKEGCSLLAPDYSGQELRLLGIVANDTVILNAFHKGLDLHLLTADRCFSLGLTEEQMTEGNPRFEKAKKQYAEQRHKAKNGANFPIIYGTTAAGVSWRQGVPVKEARRWIDSFFGLYPDVKPAMEHTERELQERGFVTTLYGRHRRFPGYNSLNKKEKAAALRQAFNFKVQGSAADQIKIAMAKIYQAGFSVVLTVHDEVIIEHPDVSVKQVGKQVQNIMENAVSFSIPFKVAYKTAKNYGELK